MIRTNIRKDIISWIDPHYKRLRQSFIPRFIREYARNLERDWCTRNDIFIEAEKQYGKMGFSDGLAFGRFLDDLLEDGLIYCSNSDILIHLDRLKDALRKELMHDIYDDVMGIIDEYLDKGSFKLSDLENAIRRNRSPMRVAPACTVKDYLDELRSDDTIEYIVKNNEIYITRRQ